MAPEQIEQELSDNDRRLDSVTFFDTFYRSFQRAISHVGGPVDRYYSINGQIIRLRFAGPALISQLTPALAHLATHRSETPSLTICIWDNASTSTPRPQLPPVRTTPRGDIPDYSDDRIHTHIGDGFISVLDAARGLAVYSCRDAAQLPLYERGAPLRSILHWWFRRSNLQLVHAGAVGTEDAGILLAGKGGSGKSTTCLTCLNSDLFYVSDDYSLIGLEPVPFAHTLYNTAKVRVDNLQRVPHLQDKISNADQLQSEKALFFLHDYFPQRIITSLPIQAILLPQVTGRVDTAVTPASARDSLSALLLSTMHQLAGADDRTIMMISQFVNALPSYHLELGSDLEQIPAMIRKILL